MALTLKFKELRPYISVIDHVSICMAETMLYQNFTFMRDVPLSYDDYYVFGIGRIESEFPIEGDGRPSEIKGREIGKGYFLGHCIEIMLSEVPREEFYKLREKAGDE